MSAVDPNALSVEQLARLLHLDPQVIEAHIHSGAPVDPNGRVHLLEYVAWLARQVG